MTHTAAACLVACVLGTPKHAVAHEAQPDARHTTKPLEAAA